MKHTEGPWVYEGYTSSRGWTIILPGSAGVSERTIKCEGWGFDEAEANARLVAAAPELLEALYLVIEASSLRSRRDPKHNIALGKAHAAIAKATRGES